MESELIFGAESDASIFDGQHGQSTETTVQMAAVPQAGEAMPSPLLHDAAKVVINPGENVVRIPVNPGEVVELPFGPDVQMLGREANGNLAIKVGDVTVILQGYIDANASTPVVVETADGKPIDIAT